MYSFIKIKKNHNKILNSFIRTKNITIKCINIIIDIKYKQILNYKRELKTLRYFLILETMEKYRNLTFDSTNKNNHKLQYMYKL